MWWSRPLLVLALLALGPAGCGFKPLYGRGDAVTAPVAQELAAVRVSGIQDRMGQQMRNRLVLALNPRGEPASARYSLEVTLRETTEGLAESSDGKSTVGRMIVYADYRLIDARTGKVVHSHQTQAAGSYRYLGPRYASVVSERDTEETILGGLADDIRTELSAWFLERRPDPVKPFLAAP